MARIRRIEDPVRAAEPTRRAAREPAAAVLALQRMAGNRAVGHLLRCKDKKDKPKRKSPAQLQAEQMAQKAAPNQTQVAFAHLPADAQHALREIIAGRPGPFLRPNDGKHSTDPETGLAKKPGIGVREYHTVPYNESYRLVVRTKGQDKSAYWDSKHTAGTYTYHRITGVPWPAAAPPPAPAPAPAPAPPRPPRRPGAGRPAAGGRGRLGEPLGNRGHVVPCPRVILRVKRFIARIIRGVLLRVVRRPAGEEGGDRRLIIVLWTAWNMGGTIRAAFNLAEYMQARGWQVEIISGYRDRDEPFFGSFPAGVPVHDLDDRRKRGVLRTPAAQAAERPHALAPTAPRRASASGPTSSSSGACAAARGSSSAPARA